MLIRSVYLQVLRSIQGDTTMIPIKTSAVQRQCDKRLFSCCIVDS